MPLLLGVYVAMINYLEYLRQNANMPIMICVVIVGIFLFIQVIGELLEFKGKVVPEFMKARKYFARKKREHVALGMIAELLDENGEMTITKTLNDVNRLLNDIDQHYSKDNIAMRDNWMKDVNDHMANDRKRSEEQDCLICELSEKLDKNNDITLSILIENKRGSIIEFSSKVTDESYPVTREQFNRIFKIYEEYEDIIKETGRTNGEVDIAIRIIRESYEKHLKNHSFIEDIRGYN